MRSTLQSALVTLGTEKNRLVPSHATKVSILRWAISRKLRQNCPKFAGFMRKGTRDKNYEDCMAVDAVTCELLSAGNSLLTGENSGNLAPSIERYEQETRESSCLASHLGS